MFEKHRYLSMGMSTVFIHTVAVPCRSINLQLIQPNETKRPQKPPKTANQALRPPSGGGPALGGAVAGMSDFSGNTPGPPGLPVLFGLSSLETAFSRSCMVRSLAQGVEGTCWSSDLDIPAQWVLFTTLA